MGLLDSEMFDNTFICFDTIQYWMGRIAVIYAMQCFAFALFGGNRCVCIY